MTEAKLAKEPSPTEVMYGLVSNFWLGRAICTAAELGVADHIGEEPRSIEDLAAATGTHQPSLYRVMRALSAGGFFAEQAGRKFGHTALSELLKSDVPGTMRYTAMSELGADHYSAWERLTTSVRTGSTAFGDRFGVPVWEYYAANPETFKVFERSMTGLTQGIHEALMAAWAVPEFRCVLDVGGGEGSLLARVLQANQQSAGILFDRPEVIAAAAGRFTGNGLAARCRTVGGNFFESLPDGADLHMMKWIIHDWDDPEAIAILSSSRRSLAEGGRLLLFEVVVPAMNEGLFPKLMDLNMFVMTGGRERTEQEYRDLLAKAGYRLVSVTPTASPLSIIEAEPV